MSRCRPLIRISFWTVAALICFMALQHVRRPRSQQQQFGRYTERDVFAMAMPVLQEILPGRDDLYLTADHGEIIAPNGRSRRVWNVDCLDGKGNDLIHLSRDADSGRLCWVGYAWRSSIAVPHPIFLTPRTAAADAQRWMRTLGYKEEWHLVSVIHSQVGVSPQADSGWLIILERPGWRAHLTIDEFAGTLMYAGVMPTR